MPQDTNDSPRKTVDKAMQVLHAFTHERQEIGVSELARELGIHKSVVSRLVGALRRWRILEQDPVTKLVRIGVGAFRLGSIFATRQNIVRVVTPYLGSLVGRTGQSAHAVLLDGNRALVIATVECPHALRVIMRVGEHRPLHSTAGGKLLLALSNPALLLEVERSPGFQRFTPNTITDPEKLRSHLARCRREGLAWNNGESSPWSGAVAAPVVDDGGHIIAAISTVYPLNVVDAAERLMLADETVAIARLTSKMFSALWPGAEEPRAKTGKNAAAR